MLFCIAAVLESTSKFIFFAFFYYRSVKTTVSKAGKKLLLVSLAFPRLVYLDGEESLAPTWRALMMKYVPTVTSSLRLCASLISGNFT